MTNQFKIPQDSLEQGLISSALENQELWRQLRNSFQSDDFSTQKYVYQFIEQYLLQYGNLPSRQILAGKFDWQPPLGDFQYWLTEMKRYVLATKITQSMQEAFEQVSKHGNPEQAMNVLLERLALIRSQQTNHIQAHDASAQARFAKYMLRQKFLYQDHNIAGLRTGMKIIDQTGIGWMPGDLIGIYARPGVGKSWWLMWQGSISWIDGKSVLVISGEMPANQLSLRLDVIMGQMMGLPIDYSMLQIGHPDVEDNYRQITEIMSDSNRWWTYDSNLQGNRMRIGDIASLIREHDPDLVLVDGISLLESLSNRTAEWEKVKELSYGLKHLATVNEIPIIVTHQAINSARGSRREIDSSDRGDDFHMPSLNDSAFGDAFVQACSDIITMVGSQDSPYINWYSIRKHRERGFAQRLPQRMAFAWHVGKGQIIDLSDKGYSPEAVGQEARRLLGMNTLS